METQDTSGWADPSTEIQSTFSRVQWYEGFAVDRKLINTLQVYTSNTYYVYVLVVKNTFMTAL